MIEEILRDTAATDPAWRVALIQTRRRLRQFFLCIAPRMRRRLPQSPRDAESTGACPVRIEAAS
jgi:transposase